MIWMTFREIHDFGKSMKGMGLLDFFREFLGSPRRAMVFPSRLIFLAWLGSEFSLWFSAREMFVLGNMIFKPRDFVSVGKCHIKPWELYTSGINQLSDSKLRPKFYRYPP